MSWRELRERVDAECENQRAAAKTRLGLIFQPKVPSYVGLLALGQLGSDLFLMDRQLTVQDAVELGRELSLSSILYPSDDNSLCGIRIESSEGRNLWSGDSTVTVLTSGSTGNPKAARHTWDSLCRPVRARSGNPGQRWLQTYRPNLYAGLQVLLQCWMSFGALVVPAESWGPSSIIDFAAEQNVQYISATPSYWRKLLISSDPKLLRKMRLKQITLGGEVVDQGILDSLKETFPGARLTHIYATTELGRCFAVRDGLAGFPLKLLNGVEDGIELKIVDGELFVKSSNAVQCYDGGSSNHGRDESPWFATGDLVEVRGDRAYFAGRKTEMINVGGNKVYPVEVERVIRQVPGVSDVRVFGRRSSISGQLVACEIVAAPGHDIAQLKNDVRRACNAKLAGYQLPRAISFVDEIQLSAAQKVVRRAQ